MQLPLALVVAAAASAALAVALWRRRSRRGPLALRVDPLPAGLKHLAATVSDLSDLGLHLSAGMRPSARKPRIGALHGTR